MPIKIKTDLDFGQIWFIKNDPDQLPHILVGITVLPSNVFKFHLSFMGDITEVYHFEASQEPKNDTESSE